MAITDIRQLLDGAKVTSCGKESVTIQTEDATTIILQDTDGDQGFDRVVIEKPGEGVKTYTPKNFRPRLFGALTEFVAKSCERMLSLAVKKIEA